MDNRCVVFDHFNQSLHALVAQVILAEVDLDDVGVDSENVRDLLG